MLPGQVASIVYNPVRGFIITQAGELLVQLPPGVAHIAVPDEPEQAVNVPVIVAGSGFTVIDLVA